MKKLNPFAFPPETNARFSLLVFGALIVVTSLSLVAWGKFMLGGFVAVNFIINTDTILALDRARLGIYLCSTPFIMIFMTLSLLGLAYLSYRRHPQRIQMRYDLQPLNLERDEKFLKSLQELAAEAQFEMMPEVKLGPKRAQDGQAFGFRNRPTIRLGTGLKAMRLYAEHLGEYRAVILHELAHIKNDDIQRSYFAEAVWKALLAFFVPLVILISLTVMPLYYDTGFDPTITRFSPFFALLTAIFFGIYLSVVLGLMVWVVHFIRRGALRVREFYADWRAAQWGAMDGLVRILANAGIEQYSWWQRLVRAHPRFQDRLKVLRDPYQLFRVSFDLSLVNGLLFGFAFGGAGTLIGLYQISRVAGFGFLVSLFFAFLCIVVFSALFWMLSGTLGLQIQREAVADQTRNMNGFIPYLRLLPLALLFHLGFEAALYLLPYENIQVDPLSMGLIATLVLPFWILGITGMTWMWMSALRFFARRWLGSHTGPGLPTLKINVLIILSMLALTVLYIPFMLTRGWPALGEGNLLAAFIALVLVGGLFIVFCAGCWVLVSVVSPPPKCPRCGSIQTRRETAGQVCIHCGEELAAWLFAH